MKSHISYNTGTQIYYHIAQWKYVNDELAGDEKNQKTAAVLNALMCPSIILMFIKRKIYVGFWYEIEKLKQLPK